jgi:hypothetical protein
LGVCNLSTERICRDAPVSSLATFVGARLAKTRSSWTCLKRLAAGAEDAGVCKHCQAPRLFQNWLAETYAITTNEGQDFVPEPHLVPALNVELMQAVLKEERGGFSKYAGKQGRS